ncbi:hypothetical protein [Enterococcus wangshanyuanii]|uniref:DUF4825 domain-containing protein n=1 Tax=Enterococcus wangshanyuanii TaxID=2005703 RepID=A0ABQ1PIJ3_9ENTE|nr:hypothetical protein [Enterococcus wangshanyuanii]GGC97805.1 hypothetical protein GCM10011573_29160 [Enterococcus wangshanyuanii]
MIKILIICVIGIIAITINNVKKKKLTDSGEIKQRSNHFMRQEHVFNTNIKSFKELYDALDLTPIHSRNIQMAHLENDNGIQFYCKKMKTEFTAYLIYADNGEVTFFINETRNEINPLDPNVILTAIEKAVFELDENATIKRELIDYDHKTGLF